MANHFAMLELQKSYTSDMQGMVWGEPEFPELHLLVCMFNLH